MRILTGILALLALATTWTASAAEPSRNCEIWRDQLGTTHLRVANEEAALACLGYVHGRDRAWQMDYLRRTVDGRLAEVYGAGKLSGDFQMRLLGLSERARVLYASMDSAQRARLIAYAQGVNKGFETEQAKSSYELRHYGLELEPWTPENSVSILFLQSLDQTRATFERRLNEAQWLKTHGSQAPELFSREKLPWETTVIKSEDVALAALSASIDKSLGSWDPAPAESAQVLESFVQALPESFGIGSNNWVVDSRHSRTGKAWFANDPHLDLIHPPFWYFVHITSDRFDAIGSSLPGAPVLANGTNSRISWGLTNAYFDVSDVARVPKAELQGVKTERPMIWVKVGPTRVPFFLKTFQRTAENWPILPISGFSKKEALVLRWSGFDLGPKDLDGLFEMLSAKSVAEADRAVQHIGLPSWNFVFADTRGEIGFRVSGKLPKRMGTEPFGVRKAHPSELKPWEFLGPSEVPHLMNPARGMIATANNRHWPAGWALSEGRGYSTSFRAFRIDELLKAESAHDLSSIRRVQCDVQEVDARFFAPLLVRKVREFTQVGYSLDPLEEKAIQALASWNYEADLHCRACAVYSRWINRLKTALSLNSEALYRWLDSSSTPSAGPRLLETLKETLNDLSASGRDPLSEWKDFHFAPFTHFSGDPIWSVQPIPSPGGEYSVNPGEGYFDEKKGIFIHRSGSSVRLIVEMSEPPTVHAQLSGSELDIERPDLADPNGPWIKWQRCETSKQLFPLDWSALPPGSVSQVPL